ncbi:MAG: hypothetical protein E7G14_05165 [Klebsiella michiganensis]|nr:hypothetical protein [Klebsiella michiganensis]MDU3715201.1 hypothetical protein [Klebsiella michiganensis]
MSILTKEGIQKILNDDWLLMDDCEGLENCTVIKELARMALAAMDSEPNRNPVLAYADSYRDMEKQGVESVPIWSVITDLERNIAPLYRHAQQPVVDADDNFYSWFGREWQDNYQHNQYTTAAKQMLGVMAESAWKAGRRAAMLQELQKSAGASNNCRSNEKVQAVQVQPLTGINPASALGSLPKTGEVLPTNYPVIPDGYVMVPMRLTAENGAKGVLSGEFSETKFVNCPECFGDDECETCDGSGRIEITVPVTWTTIKEIWAKGVKHFAAAPQEVSHD